MKYLTTASIPVALGAMVLASALSAQGTVTNTWFDAGISGYTSGTDVTNITGWAATPADGDASKVVEGAAIELDTKDSVLAYTPATPSPVGTNAIVTASIKFVAADSDPALPLPSAKACLAVRSNDGALYYVANSGGNWVRMYGANPDTAAYVTVRAELDFTNLKVRYFVGDTALANAAENGTDWIDFATVPEILSIGKVAFSGAGAVSALAGEYYYEIVSLYIVSVDGADEPILLTAAWLEANGLTNADAATINAYLAQIGDNGLPKWKSYVLGLANDATPIWIGTVANNDPAKMTLKMNGPADTLPESGIAVKYRLQKLVNNEWQAVGADQASPAFDLSLADDPTGKYRVLAVFTAE